jgi:hypothetical protein
MEETNRLIASNNSVSSVKFVDNGKFLVTGEYVSYLNFYNTSNYCLKSEIDYFGQLVGFDDLENFGRKLYVGIAHFYEDVTGGILELNIGSDIN